MPQNQEKLLTSSQLSPTMRADKLWSKLKIKALELRHGRVTVDLIVREGHVVRAEILGQHESLIAD